MLGATLIPPMSHESYTQCTQCHVPEHSAVPPASSALEVQNQFEPEREPPAATRWSAAPPQTPHSTFMRDHCDSCHGRYGRHGLQTSHPERQHCVQCHASAAVVDQMPLTP
jgi:cytochrome c-type protein NapB